MYIVNHTESNEIITAPPNKLITYVLSCLLNGVVAATAAVAAAVRHCYSITAQSVNLYVLYAFEQAIKW